MGKLESFDIAVIAILPVCALLLWLLADVAEKAKSTRWRLFWLLPAAICLLLVFLAGFEKLMLPAYLGAVLLTAGLFKPERRVRRLASAASAAAALIALPLCLCGASYRTTDFVRSFEKGFASMKAHYVLSEHKRIDWDALHDKYLPKFIAANQSHDKIENEILWNLFCAEFHDLHVNFVSDNDIMEAAYRRAGGNDYGLVITKLADGRFAAVQTAPELASFGIRNGTEILRWNGMKPAEAEQDSVLRQMQNYADADNEAFYEGMFAAGMGGDTAELTYLDESGSERTAALPKLSDDYYTRLKDACDTISQGLEAGHMSITKLNDTTACLRIKTMSFDSVSEKDQHSAMQQELRESILKLKEEGVRDMVIDIRENNGGSGTMVKAIAQLFAPEGNHYYVSDAYWDHDSKSYVKKADGSWKIDSDLCFDGENILGDEGKIVLLVTAHSVSAADHLTHVMNDFENTTVMGFTEPSGSAQGVSPLRLDSGYFCYSSSLMLNQDGTVFVDSGTDYQSGNTLDIRVPYDEQALHALFDEHKDYLMEQALGFLAAE